MVNPSSKRSYRNLSNSLLSIIFSAGYRRCTQYFQWFHRIQRSLSWGYTYPLFSSRSKLVTDNGRVKVNRISSFWNNMKMSAPVLLRQTQSEKSSKCRTKPSLCMLHFMMNSSHKDQITIGRYSLLCLFFFAIIVDYTTGNGKLLSFNSTRLTL